MALVGAQILKSRLLTSSCTCTAWVATDSKLWGVLLIHCKYSVLKDGDDFRVEVSGGIGVSCNRSSALHFDQN